MISINFSEENKKVLIVGGGKQALNKGEKFPNATYLSPSFIDEVNQDKRILKVYEPDDCLGYFLVIAATNNKDLNHQIVLDANERNILSASINADDDASVHFQKEMDYPYLHIAFSTKGTCPGYHNVLEKEFNDLYQKHEPVLQDLQIIRQRALETIPKFATRNDFLTSIVEKDSSFLHQLSLAVSSNTCKVFCFHSHKTDENEEILNSFIEKNMETPTLYCFKEDLEEIVSILHTLELNAQYYPITVRLGHASIDMCNKLEGERVEPIYFTDSELGHMMRIAHYSIYIYHPIKNDTLKEKLARSYIVVDYNEELPDVEVDACVCLLLKGGHFQKEIQQLINTYQNIAFDSKCLFEQDFFTEMLLKKTGK